MRVEPTELVARLVEAGYERTALVEARGQCALRGGILDVYPVGMPEAVRLEFFDDEVDSLRAFDVMTQRSTFPPRTRAHLPRLGTLLSGEEYLRAAHALKAMLSHRAGALRGEGRQKRLEREYGLIPLRGFFEAHRRGRGGGPRPRTGALTRNFHTALTALEAGHDFDGADSLVPVLAGFADTAIDYLTTPYSSLTSPRACASAPRTAHAGIQGALSPAALEHDEALP